jgi:hypothetical protein
MKATIFLFASVLFAFPAGAQNVTATLSGTVTVSSGAAIAGATERDAEAGISEGRRKPPHLLRYGVCAPKNPAGAI